MKPNIHPRLLSPAQAASYVGRGTAWFYEHMPLFAAAMFRWEDKSDPLFDVRKLDQIIDEREQQCAK